MANPPGSPHRIRSVPATKPRESPSSPVGIRRRIRSHNGLIPRRHRPKTNRSRSCPKLIIWRVHSLLLGSSDRGARQACERPVSAQHRGGVPDLSGSCGSVRAAAQDRRAAGCTKARSIGSDVRDREPCALRTFSKEPALLAAPSTRDVPSPAWK